MVPELIVSQGVPGPTVGREASNVIIAWTDTVAVVLIYLIYSVLRVPTVKGKLLTELQQVSDKPTWTQLEALPYLNAIIQETLSMYAPVTGALQRSPPPEGCAFSQYHVPGHVLVGTQAYSMHRKSNVYTESHEFPLERWLASTPEMREAFQCVWENAWLV